MGLGEGRELRGRTWELVERGWPAAQGFLAAAEGRVGWSGGLAGCSWRDRPAKAYCLPSPTVNWVLDPGCILQEGRACWPPALPPFREDPLSLLSSRSSPLAVGIGYCCCVLSIALP